jgi:peroxiredoxin
MGEHAATRSAARSDGLEVGDRGPDFALPDEHGVSATPLADPVAGRPFVLVFDAGRSRSGFVRELRRFAELHAEFAVLGTTIFPVSNLPAAALQTLRQDESLPFALHSDAQGDVVKGSGARGDVARAHGVPDHAQSGDAVSLIMDPTYRVQAIVGGAAVPSHADIALSHLREEAARRPAEGLALHPPVLVLPRLLSREDCRMLVEVWHRPVRTWHTDGHSSPGFDLDQHDFKVRNDFYGNVVQFVVRDRAVNALLDGKLGRRIGGEIERAFQFTMAGREPYRIACYDAAEHGSLPAHRDNPTEATRHRRFTVSINLNAEEFTGGELRFREYGEQLYRTETGMAVIWSCSLLHEVLPVTSGRRFILGTHVGGG